MDTQLPQVRPGHTRPLQCASAVSDTMNNIVDLYLLTKLEGDLQSLHGAGDDTVYGLENMAITAFAK